MTIRAPIVPFCEFSGTPSQHGECCPLTSASNSEGRSLWSGVSRIGRPLWITSAHRRAVMVPGCSGCGSWSST
ncbi:hypothetical protein D9M71_731490 [compost metagenome]